MKRSFLFRDEERRTEKKSHQRSRRTGECYFRDGQLNQWQWGLAELSPHQVEGYADEEDAHGPSISITSFHACLHLLSLFFHFFSFFSFSFVSFFSHFFSFIHVNGFKARRTRFASITNSAKEGRRGKNSTANSTWLAININVVVRAAERHRRLLVIFIDCSSSRAIPDVVRRANFVVNICTYNS